MGRLGEKEFWNGIFFMTNVKIELVLFNAHLSKKFVLLARRKSLVRYDSCYKQCYKRCFKDEPDKNKQVV